MNKEIEIPEGYEARIDGNKVIIELKKSEDERIRTRLIALVESFGQGKYKDEMLAYLEKQKEQKPAEQLGGTFTSYDIAKTFTEGQNYVIAHPEKFGLCKPAEWSEEDKEIMHDIIKYHYDQGEISPKHNKWAFWLEHKSFSPQSHWKPSENKDVYEIAYERYPINNRLVREVTKDINEDTRDGFIDGYNYCNSTHWKPSEEQMKALEDAFRKDGGNEYRKVINSLYCDLQKLL